MKKLTALILALTLLLCGCAAEPEPTTEAVTEAPTETSAAEAPTEAPTTEPEPVYTNPLSGEVLEEPYTGRLFGISISNVPSALPHVGIQEAEIVMEMFVNDSIIRCFALFTDVTKTDVIGPVRSSRLMFNDLTEHFDSILFYAGAANYVTQNLYDLGVDQLHVDTWECYQFGASFRDKDRQRNIGYEHSLMLDTSLIGAYAESKGYSLSREERDYGLLFTEDGTPADGEAAQEITVTFKYQGTVKDTTMKYDETLGKYVFWQYGKMMADGVTQEPQSFQNVVIMDTSIDTKAVDGARYYRADFPAGGTGYYACGGRIIPITWTCGGDDQPFQFFTQNGEPLSFGVGNTYIAIAPQGSPVKYQ